LAGTVPIEVDVGVEVVVEIIADGLITLLVNVEGATVPLVEVTTGAPLVTVVAGVLIVVLADEMLPGATLETSTTGGESTAGCEPGATLTGTIPPPLVDPAGTIAIVPKST